MAIEAPIVILQSPARRPSGIDLRLRGEREREKEGRARCSDRERRDSIGEAAAAPPLREGERERERCWRIEGGSRVQLMLDKLKPIDLGTVHV